MTQLAARAVVMLAPLVTTGRIARLTSNAVETLGYSGATIPITASVVSKLVKQAGAAVRAHRGVDLRACKLDK